MSILNSDQMNIYEAQLRDKFTTKESFLAKLIKMNDFLQYASWIPSSNGTQHNYLQATELGKGSWSVYNKGIASTASKSQTLHETLKMFEAESLVDERIVTTSADPTKTRDSEDLANLEGFTQSWLYQVLYCTDKVDGVEGIMERRKKIAKNLVWSAGGSGSTGLTSGLLMEFGSKGFNLIYQPGTPAGITSKDRGLIRVPDAGTNGYDAFSRKYRIEAGMMIAKDEAVQRLANISVEGATFPLSTFVKMKNQLPSVGQNAVFFVNRSIKALIENECLTKSNMAYSIGEVKDYGPVNRILGINVAMCEAIKESEGAVA